MTFTKQHVRENKEMLAMAKQLLAAKGPWVIDTTASDHPDVVEAIAGRYPAINRDRVFNRVVRAIRILRGEEIRSRGAPLGNRNATKAVTTQMWSARLADHTVEKIRRRAAAAEISQAEYVASLVDND